MESPYISKCKYDSQNTPIKHKRHPMRCLESGPYSASPVATAASNSATTNRYALLACGKSGDTETSAQTEIAVKDVTVLGNNSSDYTNGSTNGSSVDGDIFDELDGGANDATSLASGSYADGAEDPGAAPATPLAKEPRAVLPIGPTSAFNLLQLDLEAEAPAEAAPQQLGDNAASVPAATDAATPDVNVTGRFRRFDGKVFRDLCRAAIAAETLDQQLFHVWSMAHDRRRGNIKTKGRWPTISSTRARIEQAEQQAYETLLAALPQPGRIEATVTQGLGVAKEGLRVGCDTNERIRRLEGLVADMHTVTVQGQTVSGSSPSVIATQTESAIVALKQQRKAAKEAMKAEVAKTKAEAATAKAQAKARAMATKAEGTRRPINNILKQLISKGDVTPTMLLAAATVIAADASDQQERSIGTIALTDNNQTLLQAGVKQDSTQQLHKCNEDIGNDPVDSRMENRTEL
jgi:hypothetical protein